MLYRLSGRHERQEEATRASPAYGWRRDRRHGSRAARPSLIQGEEQPERSFETLEGSLSLVFVILESAAGMETLEAARLEAYSRGGSTEYNLEVIGQCV